MKGLTLIRGARLVHPGEAVTDRCDVLVGGARIIAIDSNRNGFGLDGPRHQDLVDIFDANDLLVAPGFIDAHVHLTGGGGEAGFKTRVPRTRLSDFVTAGVTTVVGLLGTDGITRTLRDLVATTLGLREEGLSAFCYTGNYAVPVVTLTGSIRDDIVFCDPILGVGELAISDHRSSQPTFDEFLRIVSDAYVAGLASGKAGIVHIHMGDGSRGLDFVRQALEIAEIPARVYQPTHLNRNRRLLAEAMELAAQRKSQKKPLPRFDLTAFPAEDCDGDTTSAADAALAWWQAGLPLETLSVSSDGGGCLPVFDDHGHMTHMGVGRSTTLLDTWRALIEAGMPVETATTLFTSNPSDALLLSSRGRIAPGMHADFAMFDADLRLSAVMANGRFMLRNGRVDPAGYGTFEKESA